MATVEDVATSIMAATDVSSERPISILTVANWVNHRYRQLVSRVRFRHLRKVGALEVPATFADGTYSVTFGSLIAVADADAQAAIAAVGGVVTGRHIRFGSVWYRIAGYAAPNLTLETPFAGETNTDQGYVIVARILSLASGAKWLGRFVHQRRRIVVENRSLNMLDWSAPDRILLGAGPWYWAENGRDSSGNVQVELYPASGTNELIYYTYWEEPADLGLLDDIPRPVELYVLREGALIDLYRYRASQEANIGRSEMAAYWRNEARAQSTTWEREVLDAIKSDQTTDDISFIYRFLGQEIGAGSMDVVTARDEVYVRGSRP